MHRGLMLAGPLFILAVFATDLRHAPDAAARPQTALETATSTPATSAASTAQSGETPLLPQASGGAEQPGCSNPPLPVMQTLGSTETWYLSAASYCPGTMLEVCASTSDDPAVLFLYRQPQNELVAIFRTEPPVSTGTYRRCDLLRIGGTALQFSALRGTWQITVSPARGEEPSAPQPSSGSTVVSITPNYTGAATRGTVVTITGSGFSTVPGETQFGEVGGIQFLDVVCASSTRCTATAPQVGELAGWALGINVFAIVNGRPSSGIPPVSFVWFGTPTLRSISPTAGPSTGGTTVTLIGGVFPESSESQAPVSVRFGSAPPVNAQCATGVVCTAVTPPGSGTVLVTITTPGGTSQGLPFSYTSPIPERPTPAPIPIPLDPR